jgi:hypothetical protein
MAGLRRHFLGSSGGVRVFVNSFDAHYRAHHLGMLPCDAPLTQRKIPSLLAWPIPFLHRSFLLTIIVEKSKMCLDFSVTYFLIHLVISSFYYGIPATADWWIVHIFSTIVMVLVGEYLCSLRELSDIPLLQL